MYIQLPPVWKGRFKMANKRNLRFCLVMIVFLVITGLAQTATITVGPGDDYDFDNIQSGINAAVDGDTVLVAPADYVITEPITFKGKLITVISETGPDEATIRMITPTDPDRASVVVFENNETTESILEGFTITGGTGSLFPPMSVWVGGGIYFNASSGTVRNCTILQNTTDHGGGIMCISLCSPKFIDCTIERNLAEISVGGLFAWGGCSITLTNCIISGNSSKDGGGIQCWENSAVSMMDCIITGNSATGATVLVTGYGGGLYCGPTSLLTAINCDISENSAGVGGGGVMCSQNSLATLTSCVIIKNSAGIVGGGIECTEGSVTLTNCVIEQNSSLRWGGGLSSHEPSSSLTISNCSIIANSANQVGGGVGCFNGSSATVTNSIFWGNIASTGNEISLEQSPTEFSIAYSNIAGGQTGISVDGGSMFGWGEGNIDVDPLFANPGHWAHINDVNIVVEPNNPNAIWIDGDYHLKSQAGRWDPYSGSWVVDDVTSPCIDAGDPNSDWSGETWPNGGRINMGAYGGTREASMSTETGGLSLPNVAYIYHDDIESAKDYQSLLNSYGCATTLIPSNEVATTGFDAYDLIIAGTDTGYFTTWTDEQNVAAVENSGKSVVGLGNGGYWYFGQLGLSIGNPYGGYSRKTSIEVEDPNSSLYKTPYVIDIPEDRALQLYSETQHIGIYLWPTIPETVTVIGLQVDDVGYHPLIMEHNRYLLWGFTESPQKMTEVGKTLFVNVVIWTANKAWESED